MKTLPSTLSLGIALVSLNSCTPPPTAETTTPTPPPSPSESSKPEEKPAPTKPKRASLTEIDVEHFFTLREEGKTRVYDVRLPVFYHLGHIKGAISLPLKPFDEIFAREQAAMEQAVSEGKVIVVYCTDSDCPDGHTIGGMIADRGIPVTVYRGGWSEWKEVGFE